MKNILSLLKNRVLVYDGAMGTMLQKKGLTAGACPEEWNILHPEKVFEVHKEYRDAGADIVETNTFGGNRLSLDKYGLGDKCRKINYHGVNIAKKSGAFVAGSVGPLPEMVKPLGRLDFDDALKIFKEQIKALSDAGADLIILETFSDIKELKIAVIAAKEVCGLPIQAQLTYTENGTTLNGTPPEVSVCVLESLGVEIIGANCGLGPKELLPIIERIAKTAKTDTFISVLPNAGLPEIDVGKTIYKLTPDKMLYYVREYHKLGVNLVGGCCGTEPAHIKTISREVKNKKPIKKNVKKRYLTLASRTKVIEFVPEGRPYIIGERLNPSRRKDLIDELCNKKSVIIRSEAREQANIGAHLLDINVSAPGIDEDEAMGRVVDIVQQTVDLPIAIDSNNPKVIEAGLKNSVGKPLINSVNGEKEKLNKILPLAKKYGAGVIALTMDEKGIPMTLAKRINIAERIMRHAEKAGIKKEDILLDFLTLTAGAQPENTEITLLAVREAKKRGWQTVLGVSNVSFGLPNRQAINSTFLAMALREGLTSAIINPKDLRMQETVSAYNILFGKKLFEVKREEKISDEPLYKCILTGDKDNILDYIEKYLKEGKTPLEINEKMLIPALTEVGRRFEKKEFFLPQLLLSAEAMQKAVGRLEKALPIEKQNKGARIVMATVKGDMHDIGKNIVCSVLKNFGFNVIDIGKDVPCDRIIKEAKENNADIIGLSALMTTTMGQMETVISELKKRGIYVPTIIGGAVITKDYAKRIGADGFAKDAISAVNEVKRILKL